MENVSTMYHYLIKTGDMKTVTNNHSRLLQELMNLERDYAVNQNTIKLKDEEIERYALANNKLQEIIENDISEIQALHCRNFKLEAELNQAKLDIENEKQSNQEKIQQFNNELLTLNKKYESLKNEHKIELRKKESEISQHFQHLVQQKEHEFKTNLMSVEEKLNIEKHSVTSMSIRLQKQLDETLQLQNKLRVTEEKYLSEKAVLEQELNSLEAFNSGLKSENATLKRNCHCLETEVTNMSSEIQKYQEDLKILNQETKTLSFRLNSAMAENDSLNKKFIEASKIYGRAVEETQEWKKKYFELQMKMDNILDSSCHDKRHEKFEDLEKQNVILQNVVKMMKKEREQFELQSKEEYFVTERRIEKLESLVNVLKEYYGLDNYCEDIFCNNDCSESD